MLGEKKGLSLVELIIVIGIIFTLIGIASVGLFPRFLNTNNLDTAVTTLIAEVRSQQIKAMIGDTEGRGINDSYGIYFEDNTYTLFHGSMYDPDLPSNLDINLFENIIVSSITFPSSVVIFEEGSGEIASFSQGNNTINIQDTVSGQTRQITINELGVITSISDI